MTLFGNAPTRAFAVVNCQRTSTWRSFRSSSHCSTAPRSLPIVPIRRFSACRASTLSSISAMFSHDPCLGV